jgi:uncharacterized damage-inducible protein DinB
MSGNLLFTIIALCVVFRTQGQSTDTLFLEAARKKLQNAKEYTLHVATLMPAEFYEFKPSPDEMNFGQQLLHLSENMGWLSSSYLNNEQNPVSKADMKLEQKDSIISVVRKVYDYTLQSLEHFSPTQLSDPVKFFAGPMNKLQIINLLNDHQTHHRAQLVVYLRIKGIKPPNYVGW